MVGLVCLADAQILPTWVFFLCGSLAILILGSFVVFALKTWEQIRPDQEEIRERELKAKLKVKGSSIKSVQHRAFVQNSAAPAFRQAGLGHYMPLNETHPFLYPSGEESERIDLTKFIVHILREGNLVVHETHSGKLIISHRDLANMPSGVVLEQLPGSEWAWKAHVEQFGPGSLDEHAEISVVGDKYANEWVFSIAPTFAMMMAVGHDGVSWVGSVPWTAIVLALGAAGWLCALISPLVRRPASGRGRRIVV